MTTQPGAPATVLDRIMAVLNAVKDADQLTVGQLADRTGLPKSTVSRLVASLVDQHYLQRTDDGVVLGMKLFELGARSSLPKALREAAAPAMKRIWDLTGERVVLWVRQGPEMVLIAALAGRLPTLSPLPTRAGARTDALTTASGKACLAFCAQSEVDLVSAPLVDRAATRFRTELAHVRETTVAVDEGVAYPGVHAVACPVLATGSTVVGALSIAGPEGTVDPTRFAPLVRSASAHVSQLLAA